MPSTISNYYEPFLGGGSVLLRFLQYIDNGLVHISGDVIASDINCDVINTFKAVQSDVDNVIKKLKLIETPFFNCKTDKCKADLYYSILNDFNKVRLATHTNMSKHAGMFVFLTKYGFRAKYDINAKGEYTNRFYHPGANDKWFDYDNMREISRLISKVVFTCQTYEHIAKSKKGDFIYLDPPYVKVKKTSYTYGQDFNNDKLMNILLKLKSNFIMSNNDLPILRKLFTGADFKRIPLSVERNFSKEEGKQVNEILIKNF